jgi:mannose-1-phosphate guanylyltransferase
MREALPFMKPEQIIAEPAKRDTAPAAALATGYVKARDPDGVLALLPADALIKDAETFARQLQQALEVAAKGESLLTFAIKPTHPATGFGYLEMAETRDDGLRRVARFVEKPDLPTAEGYLASGNYGWNAGIFLWNVAAFEREAQSNAPELVAFISDFPAGDCTAYLAERFPTLPKISVDYAIMEKASSVATMVAEFDWDDVGSWTALPSHMAQDEQGNTAKGTVVAHESSNNVAISSGRVIALCGVKDLVVVETGDSVLVCHRDAVQDIKKLMADLPPEVK